MKKLTVGCRVKDIETDVVGTIVHLYKDPKLADEIVAVKFDDCDDPVAFPIGDLRMVKG